MVKPNELKLVYVLKIGKNSKNEGLYEFIFSEDIAKVLEMAEEWLWDQTPAGAPDNAEVPSPEYCDKVLELKTDKFDLECLHDSNDKSYMDGVNTIHCLAYEVEIEEDYSSYEDMYNNDDDDSPLLVFHFGMTLEQVEDMLLSRDIIFENDKRKKKINN